MPNKSNPPNRGGSAPKVTSQKGNKGPIIGRNTAGVGKGSTQPWSLGKGKSKNLDFGKDVKKS